MPDGPDGGGRFTSNALFVLAARIVGLASGLATSVVIARVLGAAGQGRYAFAMLCATSLVIVCSLGVGPATTYQLARGRREPSVVLGNTLLLAVSVSLLSTVAGLALARFFDPEARGDVVLALATIPFTFLISSLQAIFSGLQRFKEWGLVSSLQSAIALSAIAASLLYFRAGTRGALAGIAIAYALTSVIASVWLARVTGIAFRPDLAYVREALGYGVRANIGNAVQFLNYRVDQFLVDFYLGKAQLGVYSVAVNICEQLWLVPDAASTAIFPRVAADQGAAKNAFTPVVTRNALALALLGALAALILAPWVVPLAWGAPYAAAVPALALLLPGIVVMAGAKVLGGDIAGRGKPLTNSLVALAGLGINLAGNLFAIPRYGINGAALVSTLTYAVIFGGLLATHCALTGNRPWQVIAARRSDVALWRAAATRLAARLG
ncbi:MAG: oligosaccharide flippase family protein [Acidobacteriota bacterium]